MRQALADVDLVFVGGGDVDAGMVCCATPGCSTISMPLRIAA